MNLKEYQGKQLFFKYQIPLPKGFLYQKEVHYPNLVFSRLKTSQVVLKAQIPFGKRGKVGGIVFVSKKNFETKKNQLLGIKINNFPVEEIYIEEKLTIIDEYYLSLTVSRENQGLVLIFSDCGGVDIEETVVKNPQRVIKIILENLCFERRKIETELKKFNLGQLITSQIIKIVKKMLSLIINEDALLVEINPLARTKNNLLLAADAKVIIDDNALFRHPYLIEEKKEFSLEKKAKTAGLTYVELKGDIAVIGNGAGLVMDILDTIAYFGGKPANFLDVGGGADREKMKQALEICLAKKGIAGLLINIFGGITRCDEIAQGIVDFHKERKINLPLVVRLLGTNEEKGRKILGLRKIFCFKEFEPAVKKIIRLTRNV